MLTQLSVRNEYGYNEVMEGSCRFPVSASCIYLQLPQTVVSQTRTLIISEG